MLRSGNALRLTRAEIETCRRVGLDPDGVRTDADFAAAFEHWIDALGEVRPDMLEKFVRELAAAKGLRLPPHLTAVSSSDSPD